MGNPTVTSVKVDEDIWKEAKIQAIKDGKKLQDVLNEALKEWLAEQKKLKKEYREIEQGRK
ncbi:MAG: hypothetical protein OK438_04045 [Thaumarchaeota archaeon]|nr:hypothetical protein [Nitrososphaerota archaeon]